MLSKAECPYGAVKAAYFKDLDRFWAPVTSPRAGPKHTVLLEPEALLADVGQRIDGLAVEQNLEMQIRTGRSPRLAHSGDDLAALTVSPTATRLSALCA